MPQSDFVLDTGIILRHLRNDMRAHALLDYTEGIGDIAVSVITYMEILIGCRPSENAATLLLFDRVPPVTITREIAQKAVSLITTYPAAFGRNNPRGFPDSLIAATAWQYGSTLITFNTRHFANMGINELAIRAIDQNERDWVATIRT